MPITNGLPDGKGALIEFYQEQLKKDIEKKSSEYKDLFNQKIDQFNNDNKRFQQAALIILLTGLTLTTIHYFGKEND